MEELEFLCPVAGFFDQLARSGDVWRLGRFERAGRELDQRQSGSDAPVADEADAAVIEQWNDDASARVADDLASFRFATCAGDGFANDAEFGGGE